MAERKKLLLRLDPEVYEGIARWAADDIRSVNAQIEFVLRRALRAAGRHGGAPAQAAPDPAATAEADTHLPEPRKNAPEPDTD
jgi:hypothetical protein